MDNRIQKMTSINSKQNNQEAKERMLFKANCKYFLDQGLTTSAIAKKLGKSYKHTSRICNQVKDEN